MKTTNDEPGADGGPEDQYGSMTPAIRNARQQKTDRNRRTAYARKRLAHADKVAAERMAAESAERAQEARVGLEGDLIALDPRRKRRSSLPWAVAAVILVAAVDGLPAYWASEALGHGIWPTTIVAVILVAALGGFAVLMTHFGHEGKRRLFWIAGVLALLMIGVQTGLRLEFLVVTSDAGWLSAGLEAALLAGITLSLVWIGYVILHRAESAEMWRQRRSVEKLERAAERCDREAEEAGKNYFASQEGLEHVERSRVGQREHLDGHIDEDLRRRAAAAGEADANGPVPPEPDAAEEEAA